MSAETKTIPGNAEKTFYGFPASIWAVAEHVAVGNYRGDDFQESKLAIAKAINDAVMAETERCAHLLEGTSDRLRLEGTSAAREIISAVLIECADVIRLPAAPKAEG